MTKSLRWETRIPRKRGEHYIHSIPIGKHMGKIEIEDHFKWACSCGLTGKDELSYAVAIAGLRAHYEKVREK